MTRYDGPVTMASPVRARADVTYTEIDGRPVLCDPVARTVHELSPAAAALWGCLDGRPLAEHRPAPPSTEADLGLVELVRRLRVMGLLEGQMGPTGATGPAAASPLASDAPPGEAIELAGREHDVGAETVLVLERWPGSDRVTIDADLSRVGRRRRGLRALAIVDANADPGPLTPLVALGALVGAAAPRGLAPDGLDRLAGLAESRPTIRVPDPSAIDAAVAAVAR